MNCELCARNKVTREIDFGLSEDLNLKVCARCANKVISNSRLRDLIGKLRQKAGTEAAKARLRQILSSLRTGSLGYTRAGT